MSAFIVGKPHIDALVRVAGFGPHRPRGAGDHWYSVTVETDIGRLDPQADEDRVGRLLWLENYASVAHRYSDHLGELPGPIGLTFKDIDEYRFEQPMLRPTAVQALKLIDCYEYQSCEHDGWRTSPAYRFCQDLRTALCHYLPGYAEAPWEWEYEA